MSDVSAASVLSGDRQPSSPRRASSLDGTSSTAPLARANGNLDPFYQSVAHARTAIIITARDEPDDAIVYANEGFLLLTGYTRDEVIGRNCRFLQGPETDPATRDRLRTSIERGEGVQVEIRNYRKDGTSFLNDVLVTPIHDEFGRVTHFLGNQIDASRRAEAKAQLWEEREEIDRRIRERTEAIRHQIEYLESIVDAMAEALLVLDLDLRVISANDTFYDTFQTSRASTEGRLLFELGNGQWEIPRLRALLLDANSEHRTVDGMEVAHQFPLIGHRIMMVNARRVLLRGSGHERILLTIEDVTERRRAEASSLRSAALTDAVLSSLHAHIAVIDRHGTIIAVNDAWTRFGRDNRGSGADIDYVGVNYLEVLRASHGIEAAEAPATLRGIEAVIAGDLPDFSLEYPCDTLTQRLWFLLQVTPLRLETGGAVIAHIDITDRKRIEARKDDFISIASHELKTPLTSMKIFVQILRRRFQRRGLSEDAAQLSLLDAQIDKLTRLINELLDVSLINAGKLAIRMEPFDLAILIGETVDSLQAATPHVTLVTEPGSPILIEGDRDRIDQILVNLLTNAIKYSSHGGQIETAAVATPEGASFSVRDHGIGIDLADQTRIFERFYQVGDGPVRMYPGLGMGLYISSEIVKRHGGKIWVESEKGQGATFHVTLPASLPPSIVEHL